jgi:hypothetical protein
MLLLSAACADSKSPAQTLPRSFGPVTLGMTEEKFKEIARGSTEEFCAHCADYESRMSVEVEEFPGVYPAYIYALPESARGFSVSFYKGKLYLIETSPEIVDIEAAKKKYGEKFGQPKSKDWKNGLSFATWEDSATAVVMTYVRQQDKNQGYPLIMPVGTVSSIEYIDKPVRDELEAQEQKKPTRDSPN